MITSAVLLQWLAWGLLPSAVPAAPTHSQLVLQVPSSSNRQPLRKLHGRFLHITDIHPDPFYKVHSSTEETIACHRGHGPAGTYGAETSDCDSPFSLVNATLDWISKNIKDDIDFVIWTGDSARHDSDEQAPRHNKEILETNRQIANSFSATFSDKHGLTIPIVPTFGNNDIFPHNILMPGPNDVLRSYTDIWRDFIPEAQRHSFEFGGWFYVEVIPNKLAVFSLNTMYFFDRNAGIDDCIHPSEPGTKHFEWLRIQLQFMRNRGMKAILMGHVPPARTATKQLWDETCWQKYTLWLQQYRDVVAGSIYGHMNIDHFLLQDTKDLDFSLIEAAGSRLKELREPLEDDMSINSGADYLLDLRNMWSQLPKPASVKSFADTQGKKKKKKNGGKKHKKDKLGGPYAEHFQLSLVSPSIVPNYFPSIRIVEYNISGLENAVTWVDHIRGLSTDPLSTMNDVDETVLEEDQAQEILELRAVSDETADAQGKKKKKKKPKQPSFTVPDPPPKSASPGPAYSPQPLTFTGFTQYYANLTRINNDIASSAHSDDDGDVEPAKWNPGKHHGKKPKHDKPSPNEFTYEVEYDTFNDRIYKLKDLTVRSFVELAHTIGQTSAKAKVGMRDASDEGDSEDEFDQEDTEAEDSEGEDEDEDEDEEEDDEEDEDEDDDIDSVGEPDEPHVEGKKGNKGKKGKKAKRKSRKVWLHFAKHAFVSTRSTKQLKGIDQ
ncbi:Metallo-dependent phosphatase-like protein [Microdochium trichocladiopsis]|uniref:Endopolyphosphatase n=1 Tax=Microdochium trichocladiopsis TaxID=1682393 RepID=A0A9P9BT46_9PEZI|nr:Metallo-dependent phosphatase-like protein [Microdochium trichocladiopsis]KAH7035117.1 Metallo-dependent phosphatase-like protein [Microdochium trichocladiopsis]